jgi:hydroxymethylpyrimidine/phosphomethylpyrimidine kinase
VVGGDAEGGLKDRAPVVLTIAGSDSGAGAGIQADLKTFAALGVYGTTALTAATAQNTLGVRSLFTLPASIVGAQIDAIFDDFNVTAVKIGMLASAEIAETVAKALSRFSPHFVVLDPVMIASSGDPLLAPATIVAMKSRLFSMLDCLTPNLSEAASLLGEALADDEAGMVRQGRALLKLGPRAVLMKGGHLASPEVVDILITETQARFYVGPRIASRNLHGTGCTLSAAISAYVVRGCALEEAIGAAKTFVEKAIAAGRDVALGSGPGPLMHLPLKALRES